MQKYSSSASLINLDIVLRIQPRDLKTRSSDCSTRNEWFSRIILKKILIIRHGIILKSNETIYYAFPNAIILCDVTDAENDFFK